MQEKDEEIMTSQKYSGIFQNDFGPQALPMPRAAKQKKKTKVIKSQSVKPKKKKKELYISTVGT